MPEIGRGTMYDNADEMLRVIRLTVQQLRTEDLPGSSQPPTWAFVQHARDLADAIESLDQWLAGGGAFPRAWF